jgi:glutamyl-tRNA reductase
LTESQTFIDPWLLFADANIAPSTLRAELQATFESHAPHSNQQLGLYTCHRAELYGFGELPPLLQEQDGSPMHSLRGRDAVLHMMRVAAGLESSVPGEQEVLQQVRKAFKQASSSRKLDGRLSRLFQLAIRTGRMARNGAIETEGLTERAIAWLGERGSLSRGPLIIVGAGHVGASLVASAQRRSAEIIVASRSGERATNLAASHGARAVDLVGAAALAPSAGGIAIALKGTWKELSSGAELLPPVVDLSAPPALTDDLVRALNGSLLTIDDLFHRRGSAGRQLTSFDSQRAGNLAESATDSYMAWLTSRNSVGAVKQLQDRINRRRLERLSDLLRKMPDLDERQRQILETFSKRLVADVLHEPLRSLRHDADGGVHRAAMDLFKL